jgi:hypothetical protein
MLPNDLLRYVAFKKIIFLASVALAAVVVALALLVHVRSPFFEVVVALAILLVATEALNSAYMQILHNVPDRWTLLYPFH